ncbi:hypothetical protein D9757_011509 [Collybiopsis confluens]|uniref:Uncharacterized protein n=1 Tax=Collybiopsis confluens TaxID=2823264 RepID=A0A8H5H7E4_9AGAR|nr:hypothetical protein D9757_011509 [Collybiopsis confluens]
MNTCKIVFMKLVLRTSPEQFDLASRQTSLHIRPLWGSGVLLRLYGPFAILNSSSGTGWQLGYLINCRYGVSPLREVTDVFNPTLTTPRRRSYFSTTICDNIQVDSGALDPAHKTPGYHSSSITIGEKKNYAKFDLEIWTRRDTSDLRWRRTIERYWKNPPPPEQEIITIETARHINSGLYGGLQITAERQLMYKRVRQVHQAHQFDTDQSPVRGLIMIGQPGIGKSSFMIRELGAGRPVYILNSTGKVFFVAKEGVWLSLTTKLLHHDHFPVPEAERLLVLIDSSQCPDPAVQDAGFVVFCPSPGISRCKEMLKHAYGLFIMNPWRWDELRRYAYSKFPQLHKLNPAVVRDIVCDAEFFCPPTPRDLEAYLPDVLTQNNRFNPGPNTNRISLGMRSSLDLILSAKELTRHLSTAIYDPHSTHKLLRVQRTEEADLSILPHYDSSHLVFASRHAEMLVLQKLPKLHREKLYLSYLFLSRTPNGAGTQYGFLFMRTLCHDHAKDKYVRFGDVARAELQLTTVETKSQVKEDNVGKGDDTKEGGEPNDNEEGDKEKNGEWDDVGKEEGSNLRIFSSHDELMPTPGVLWIPRTNNNPLFDAVIFEPGNGKYAATAWVIQLPTVTLQTSMKTGMKTGMQKLQRSMTTSGS